MGIIDKTMIKFLLRSVLFIPALFFYLKDLKEYFLFIKIIKLKLKKQRFYL